MTISVYYHHNEDYGAVALRQLFTQQFASEGIIASRNATPFAYTVVNSTTLSISAGTCVVQYDDDSSAGLFMVLNDDDVNVTITTPSTNKRRHLVYLEVEDTFYGDADDQATIKVASSSDSASPTLPSLPNNSLPLWDVTVTTAGLSSGVTYIDLRREADVLSQATAPSGEVKMWAGSTVPFGYLDCNGQSISKTAYPSLFAAIGYQYGGSGDTFNVPDYRGRTLVGVGTGSGLTARLLGVTGGAETVTLTSTQLPAHNHTASATGTVSSSGAHRHLLPGYLIGAGTGISLGVAGYGLQADPGARTIDQYTWPSDTNSLHTHTLSVAVSIGNTGSNQGHANMQPFAAAYFIIKT